MVEFKLKFLKIYFFLSSQALEVNEERFLDPANRGNSSNLSQLSAIITTAINLLLLTL